MRFEDSQKAQPVRFFSSSSSFRPSSSAAAAAVAVAAARVSACLAMDATGQQEQHAGDGGGDRYGVLLYYKYAEVPDAAALAAFYEAHCRGLALVGRVRVGPDGVNATVRTCPPALLCLLGIVGGAFGAGQGRSSFAVSTNEFITTSPALHFGVGSSEGG